ncbi:hypothetical protein D3C80_1926390 [compost metagenome]
MEVELLDNRSKTSPKREPEVNPRLRSLANSIKLRNKENKLPVAAVASKAMATIAIQRGITASPPYFAISSRDIN